ncbi:hypothetical protein [Nitrobacter sp.]|uniref:hypothetical protein n=1 Tax=Nitrobacter sp. TaxID=29420 RepID=UPI0029CAB319|nr:hypothetical protein [Nitrobacter sp.]
MPARAQTNQPHWYGVDTGSQARLIHGVPGGDGSLIFVCDKGTPALSFYLAHRAAGAAPGTALPVRLSNGRTAVEFRATIQDLDRPRLAGQAMLDAPLETILASPGRLSVSAGGVTESYPLDGAAKAAAPILALCGSAARAAPAADLAVTVTNKTRRRVEQIALREPDGIERDSDAFGYDGLAPGRRRTFIIPGGAGICTYEISVLFEEKEEDCCSDPLPIGQQNLCDDPRIVVHD